MSFYALAGELGAVLLGGGRGVMLLSWGGAGDSFKVSGAFSELGDLGCLWDCGGLLGGNLMGGGSNWGEGVIGICIRRRGGREAGGCRDRAFPVYL